MASRPMFAASSLAQHRHRCELVHRASESMLGRSSTRRSLSLRNLSHRGTGRTNGSSSAGKCRLASRRISHSSRRQQRASERWDDSSFARRGPIPTYFYVRSPNTILQPQFTYQEAWGGMLTLTGVNLAVLGMWNVTTVEDEDERKKEEHEEFMLENFTVNLTNVHEGRPWTLATCSISHQALMHFAGNMFAMWLFGFNTYRVIGTKAFYGLYAAGGVACAASHLLHNRWTGRTDPPLSKEERDAFSALMELEQREQQQRQFGGGGFGGEDTALRYEERVQLQKAKERISHADMPSLGASGSVMAISAVAAALFPLDSVRINPRFRFFIPLPFAVAMYVASDLAGITEGEDGGDGVDHAGHLGGLLMGMLYVYSSWYGKRGSFRFLHSHPTGGDLPIIYRMKEMVGSTSKGGAGGALTKRKPGGRFKL